MAEPDKQQIGDGQDDYAGAARNAANAMSQISGSQSSAAAGTVGGAAAGDAAAASSTTVANASAATIQASVEGGKAVAEIAAGTAAGGPWGAILSAAWAMRHTLFKVLICLCLVQLIIIILIVSLPGIVFNQVFRTDPNSFDPNAAIDMYERTDDMADVIAACIQKGYDAALNEVEDVIERNGYDYETSMEALINHGSLSPDYDVAFVLAAYSASMQQKGISEADMRRKLEAVADKMFEVTYAEKEFERIVPLSYMTYAPISITVVTGKTQVGIVNGTPQYSYSTSQRTLYEPSGELITEIEIERPAYREVTVEVPVYRYGIISETRTETYYDVSGTERLVPETETVKYAEATIHPFDQSVILKAFQIDPDAAYDQFNTTYGQAIETMANVLKRTLYGTTYDGGIPTLTDDEHLAIVGGVASGDVRKKLVETGLSLVGKVKYFWGGKSKAGWNSDWGTPKKVTGSGSVTSGTIRPYGLDCSGFTDWVYKTALGVSIGTGSSNQWSKSTEITEAELLPGDLGFKARPGDPGTNHVLMYVGKDNNGKKLWVHCSSSKGGVVCNSPSYVKYYRRPNNVDFSSGSIPGIGQLGEPLSTLRVNVTHYCACAKCCGDSADGITASGKRVAEGMVAMSSHYPFGTLIEINGTVYTVEDRGGKKIESDISRVDIFIEDHQQALRLGRFWAEAKIYRLGK